MRYMKVEYEKILQPLGYLYNPMYRYFIDDVEVTKDEYNDRSKTDKHIETKEGDTTIQE